MSSSARASLAGISAHEDSNKYTSNFSAGVDGWIASAGTVAGNIDGIGGQNDNLRFTIDATSTTHHIDRANQFTIGNTYRIRLSCYLPDTNDTVDGVRVYHGSGDYTLITDTNAWTAVDVYTTATATGFGIYAADGGSLTFQDAGGDDVFYIRNVIVDRWTRIP